MCHGLQPPPLNETGLARVSKKCWFQHNFHRPGEEPRSGWTRPDIACARSACHAGPRGSPGSSLCRRHPAATRAHSPPPLRHLSCCHHHPTSSSLAPPAPLALCLCRPLCCPPLPSTHHRPWGTRQLHNRPRSRPPQPRPAPRSLCCCLRSKFHHRLTNQLSHCLRALCSAIRRHPPAPWLRRSRTTPGSMSRRTRSR